MATGRHGAARARQTGAKQEAKAGNAFQASAHTSAPSVGIAPCPSLALPQPHSHANAGLNVSRKGQGRYRSNIPSLTFHLLDPQSGNLKALSDAGRLQELVFGLVVDWEDAC